MGQFGIGQAVRREEDPRLLRGKGNFVNDVNLPNQSHAVIFRSPHAKAKIVSLDASTAAEAPGVLAVYTGQDVAADGLGTPSMAVQKKRPDGSPMFTRAHPGLVTDQVRYVGDPIAMVVAETIDQAKDAAELIDIEFEPLNSVTSTAESLNPESAAVWEECPDNISFLHEAGDKAAAAAAFDQAAQIIKRRFVITRVYAHFMEVRGALAAYDDKSERYTIHVDVQYPHRMRDLLANEILHIPEAQLRVVAGDIGGAFGTKGPQYVEHRLTLWASEKLKRPVKWTCERSEAIQADEHGRDVIFEAELALDVDHNFIGFRASSTNNVGAYISSMRNIQAGFGNIGGIVGVYDIPAAYVAVTGAMTNTNSTAPYRGAGRPEASYVIERLIDEAAREIHIDPAELRRQNFILPEDLPYQTSLVFNYDSGDFPTVMEKALAMSDYAGFAGRREASDQIGKLRGIGIANAIERAGSPAPEFGEIRFSPTGKVTLLMGTKNQGQGHETMYKQIAAETLGVALADMRFVDGDTDLVAHGTGTMGSRSAVIGGSALYRASEKIIAKGTKIAAHLLEAGESDIEFADGVFAIVGTDRSLTITEIAMASFKPAQLPEGMAPGLIESGTFAPKQDTFPNGSHVCEVEIDPATGEVEILNYSVVDDVGTVINPLTLKGQIYGGIAQGVGQVLMEQVVYDQSSGQLLSGSFMDYAMPRADNFGPIEIESHAVPTALNPLGVKGAGEAGTVGALPALMNAIMNALAVVGVKHLDLPASPERIWQAIQEAK
ncbi:MAG: xanthine dehydrogenase family protein molybdopterin-binding subunit [Rhodospirillaceae bacterium]|mgnify:CR=1 FL=1|jgi:aerobic carbon-monoxide dehydrogenase large subunit|nr:xanthine dehydrogenase family protein molybdopterin-binding subunit [Rhodospirillaceae bacterium]MBT7956648.1 xanthine dehydrogenase family protein molybdopterin-binding subunit [Rhodospirillaceae bacterium]